MCLAHVITIFCSFPKTSSVQETMISVSQLYAKIYKGPGSENYHLKLNKLLSCYEVKSRQLFLSKILVNRSIADQMDANNCFAVFKVLWK